MDYFLSWDVRHICSDKPGPPVEILCLGSLGILELCVCFKVFVEVYTHTEQYIDHKIWNFHKMKTAHNSTQIRK